MRVTPQILCQIICEVTKIPTDHVWIWNQRRAIPEKKGLYIAVGLVSMKPYSNMMKNVPTTGGMEDRLSQYMQEICSIDLFSYDTEAIEKTPLILGALRSTYSQQQQELLGLKIAEILTINNVSEVEGSAILYRQAITLKVLRKYDTMTATQYYDQFEIEDTLTQG